MSIFVWGASHGFVQIGAYPIGISSRVREVDDAPAVTPYWRVLDVLNNMRRRRLIPQLSRIRPAIHFDSFRRAALPEDKMLGELGVGDLSILHLRYSVPGGSSRGTSGKVISYSFNLL